MPIIFLNIKYLLLRINSNKHSNHKKPKLYLNKSYIFLLTSIHNYRVIHKTISQLYFRSPLALICVAT